MKNAIVFIAIIFSQITLARVISGNINNDALIKGNKYIRCLEEQARKVYGLEDFRFSHVNNDVFGFGWRYSWIDVVLEATQYKRFRALIWGKSGEHAIYECNLVSELYGGKERVTIYKYSRFCEVSARYNTEESKRDASSLDYQIFHKRKIVSVNEKMCD